MKLITKLTFLAAVAALGTGVALADNDQHAKLLELQRQKAERNYDATVAVYAGGPHAQHQTTVVAERVDVPTQLERDSHGGFYIVRAPSYR